MAALKPIHADINTLDVDAIVKAANSSLLTQWRSSVARVAHRNN